MITSDIGRVLVDDDDDDDDDDEYYVCGFLISLICGKCDPIMAVAICLRFYFAISSDLKTIFMKNKNWQENCNL